MCHKVHREVAEPRERPTPRVLAQIAESFVIPVRIPELGVV